MNSSPSTFVCHPICRSFICLLDEQFNQISPFQQMRTIALSARRCCKNWKTLMPKRTTWTSHSSRFVTRATLASTASLSFPLWSTSGVAFHPFIEVIWWPSKKCSNGFKRIVSSSRSSIYSCTPLVASHRDLSSTLFSFFSASKDPIKRLPKSLSPKLCRALSITALLNRNKVDTLNYYPKRKSRVLRIMSHIPSSLPSNKNKK